MKIYENKSHFFLNGGGGAPVLDPRLVKFLRIQWSFIGTNSTTLYLRMPCANVWLKLFRWFWRSRKCETCTTDNGHSLWLRWANIQWSLRAHFFCKSVSVRELSFLSKPRQVLYAGTVHNGAVVPERPWPWSWHLCSSQDGEKIAMILRTQKSISNPVTKRH